LGVMCQALLGCGDLQTLQVGGVACCCTHVLFLSDSCKAQGIVLSDQ
jgi:hypothetical protein